MKRCPQCGRDYNDDSLSFCLDDGSELLFGPSRSEELDERQTAILHETSTSGEDVTLAQPLPTGMAAAQPTTESGIPKRPFDYRLIVAAAAVVIIAVGAFVGYRSFSLPVKQIESIAVMPFVNESGSADVEYLSDGMTETLIKSLSQVPNLAVKSRSTVFYYKGKETSVQKIAEELGVQAVLLGRIGVRGDSLKLSLELVNASNLNVIWAEQYDRKQTDIVALQSDIARDVSSKLKIKLSGVDEAKVTDTSTTNPEAYQAYLKGRYHWNRRTADNFKKAIEQFTEATNLDPNYALAYSGLADCYSILHQYSETPPNETLPLAIIFAERALAIDPTLAEPHASLGMVHHRSWRWAEAEQEFKRAIELNPNYSATYHWYSILLRILGRYDEEAAMIRRARELDPLSSIIGVAVSSMYQLQNDHNASIESSLKVIEIDPNFALGHLYLGLSCLKQGRNAEAVTALEKAAALGNRESIVLRDLGFVYAATGRRIQAMALLEELETRYGRKQTSAGSIAQIYAGFGEKDKAFEWLEKDLASRHPELSEIQWRMAFETIRDDPRYKDILRRMDLPE